MSRSKSFDKFVISIRYPWAIGVSGYYVRVWKLTMGARVAKSKKKPNIYPGMELWNFFWWKFVVRLIFVANFMKKTLEEYQKFRKEAQ